MYLKSPQQHSIKPNWFVYCLLEFFYMRLLYLASVHRLKKSLSYWNVCIFSLCVGLQGQSGLDIMSFATSVFHLLRCFQSNLLINSKPSVYALAMHVIQGENEKEKQRCKKPPLPLPKSPLCLCLRLIDLTCHLVSHLSTLGSTPVTRCLWMGLSRSTPFWSGICTGFMFI